MGAGVEEVNGGMGRAIFSTIYFFTLKKKKDLHILTQFLPHSNPVKILLCIIKDYYLPFRGKLRHGEVKPVAQGPIAGKSQGWDLNPGKQVLCS